MENFNGLDLSKIPVVAPPPGQVSNFVDPPSQSVLVKAFTIVTLPPMVVLLVMRFHTRIRISGLGMDDYLCALAAVGIVAYVALCLSAIELSGGRHLWDIPLAKLTPTYVRLCNILANVYMVTAMLIKIALLIQYRRIFHPSPVANLLLWFGIVSTALIYIICMCILLAYCVPRPEDYPLGGWVSLSYSNRCRMPSAYVVLLSGILGTVIDIYVLTIPLAFLWGLKTTVKRKAGLSAIFLAGSACRLSREDGHCGRSKARHNLEHLAYVCDEHWRSQYRNCVQLHAYRICAIQIVAYLVKELAEQATIYNRYSP
ncbi:unnamed protein product [Clonostachys rosea f. rosea IK726]|uniref:Uncharacterized protein n=1 Tax=Clonostachys rosea f. rosea IK726 TaxID=1349383 RepID=A0ACA9TLG8_BIOOC|nr:unnamed protein product [Clonostachys rosea f. rosea IK726]